MPRAAASQPKRHHIHAIPEKAGFEIHFPRVDDLCAFDIERLHLVGGDLALVDLLAGSGIVRPERDPGRGRGLVSIRAAIVGEEPPYRWRRTLLPSTPIRQAVLVHIDRR